MDQRRMWHPKRGSDGPGRALSVNNDAIPPQAASSCLPSILTPTPCLLVLRRQQSVFLHHAELLHPHFSPISQITKISLWILASPLSQRKPEVACVFACLYCTLVVGRSIEESLSRRTAVNALFMFM